MGNTKKVAKRLAQRIANETGEIVFLVRDSEYAEIYGEKSAWVAVRESFAGESLTGMHPDPDRVIVAEIYPS